MVIFKKLHSGNMDTFFIRHLKLYVYTQGERMRYIPTFEMSKIAHGKRSFHSIVLLRLTLGDYFNNLIFCIRVRLNNNKRTVR